jgi:hypothetical protein
MKIKFFVYDTLDWFSYFLCELAFIFDCWGFFGWWIYPWGCNVGGLVVDLGIKWKILVDNPNKNQQLEPLYLDVRKM